MAHHTACWSKRKKKGLPQVGVAVRPTRNLTWKGGGIGLNRPEQRSGLMGKDALRVIQAHLSIPDAQEGRRTSMPHLRAGRPLSLALVLALLITTSLPVVAFAQEPTPAQTNPPVYCVIAPGSQCEVPAAPGQRPAPTPTPTPTPVGQRPVADRPIDFGPFEPPTTPRQGAYLLGRLVECELLLHAPAPTGEPRRVLPASCREVLQRGFGVVLRFFIPRPVE